MSQLRLVIVGCVKVSCRKVCVSTVLFWLWRLVTERIDVMQLLHDRVYVSTFLNLMSCGS